MNIRYCAALLACSGLLSGCGLWSNDSEDTGGHAGNGAAGAGVGVGGGTTNTGGSGQSGDSNQAGFGGDLVHPTAACGSGTPDVPATTQIPRLLNRQYEAVMRDLLGVTALPDSNSKLRDMLPADSNGPMSTEAWKAYQKLGEQIAHLVMAGPNKGKFIDCEPADADCLNQTIKDFGRKAFRRPLTDAEVERFQKLGQTMPAPTPAELAETTLYAFLVSPSFLMLPELAIDHPVTGKPGTLQLSSYEVATRLSILLWGSIPDEPLGKAADKNELQTKEQILTQAKRMLGDRGKTAPMLEAFHRQWLHIDAADERWGKIPHDSTIFPAYTENAIVPMQAELDAFFVEVMFGHGAFKDFFLSNVGFVNRDTAAIYGLDPARYGSELTRVELDSKQRAGFLTRAGFLSSYSYYNATSPFGRGGFIVRSILGVDLPRDPTDSAISISGEFKTNREYSEAFTSQQPCKGCHEVFSPFGYALENYDAIGGWQTVDRRGGAIDATATLLGRNGVAPMAVSSPLQLMQAIAGDRVARQVYADAWVSFAYGRPLGAVSDKCTAETLRMKLESDDYQVHNVPADLTQTDSFRLRVRETP